MWHNSSKEDLFDALPPPETNGWKKINVTMEATKLTGNVLKFNKIYKKQSLSSQRAVHVRLGVSLINAGVKRRETFVGRDVHVKVVKTYMYQLNHKTERRLLNLPLNQKMNPMNLIKKVIFLWK